MDEFSSEQFVQNTQAGRETPLITTPESPYSRHKPENRRKENFSGWKPYEWNGETVRVATDLISIRTESGVEGSMKLMVVDFRDLSAEGGPVFIDCPGFPGFSKNFKDGVMEGKFDDSKVTEDLDFDLIEKARQARGVVFFPEMSRLPHAKTGQHSFAMDGEVIVKGIEHFTRLHMSAPVGFDRNISSVCVSGYSNGAGEAEAVVQNICHVSPPETGGISEIVLRKYSLVGTVPIENVTASFSQEVLNLAMLEIANRYQAVTGEKIDPTVKGNTKVLIKKVAWFLATNPKAFLEQVGKSANAEGGGNLQIGLDLIRKLWKSGAELPRHMQKYGTELDRTAIDSRVDVQLVIPSHDSMVEKGILSAIAAATPEQDVQSVIQSLMTSEGLALDPSWPVWGEMYPNAGRVQMALIGEGRHDPASTHTGPPLAGPRLYREAELTTVIDRRR